MTHFAPRLRKLIEGEPTPLFWEAMRASATICSITVFWATTGQRAAMC
ncbi:MAG: hypothetical protein WBP54_05035 [Pelodictyon phaeoclathratiforme]